MRKLQSLEVEIVAATCSTLGVLGWNSAGSGRHCSRTDRTAVRASSTQSVVPGS